MVKSYILLNRRSYWRSKGCTEEEIIFKERLNSESFSRLLYGFVIVLSLTQFHAKRPDTQVPSFETQKLLAAFINAIVICIAWLVDVNGNPPPLANSDVYHSTKTIVGPFAFFTKQALTIQTVYTLLSLLAEFSLMTHRPHFYLLAAVHATSTPVAVVGVSLTLLFLRLNWFEQHWQKENLQPWRRRGVPLATITLTGHLLSLPVAFFDLFFVKRQSLLYSPEESYQNPFFSSDARRSLLILASYAILYVALTLANASCNGGHFPYPFMRALNTPLKWIIFTLALIVFNGLIVLPTVLTVKYFAATCSSR